MRGKAPGPDRWEANHYLSLPPAWWEAFCDLWSLVLRSGHIPATWKQVLIALISKPSGGTRPLGLCQLAWRIGARAVNKSVRAWILSWTEHGSLGSAPSRGIGDAHSRLLWARRAGVQHFIKQDLSKFFDCIDIHAAVMVLQRLGAPTDLCRLISQFYTGQTRLFKFERYFSPRWTQVSRGCIQGCPLSPTIALALGHLWSIHCTVPGTNNLIYVDDRVIWPTSANVASLEAALDKSKEYDQVLGFECRPSKCGVAQPFQDHTLDALSESRGYPVQHSLEILGIVIHFNGETHSLLKLRLRLLVLRLRFLRVCRPSMQVAKQVASSLITSAMVWAAGVAIPDKQELDHIRQELRAVLKPHFTDEAPWFLICAVHGWEFDPAWICQWRALQAAWRFHTNSPEWLDTVPLADAFPRWMQVLPVAAQAIAEHGWEASPTGHEIYRFDVDGNQRCYGFGCDSIQVLRHWLEEAFQHRHLHMCGRVRRSYHRREEGLAVGLDLPRPDASTHYALSAHRLLGKDGSLEQRRAAFATGGTGWYAAAKARLPDSQGITCICGDRLPSRPHLTWRCPGTAALRAGVRIPRDRAEERLFAAPLPPFPGAPAQLDYDNVVEELALHLKGMVETSQVVIVATDGSTHQGVGACAVVTPTAEFAFGDSREDQSAFKFELFALLTLLRSLSQIPLPISCQIYILSDCEAALQAILEPQSCCLPSWALEAAQLCQQIRATGVRLQFQWVPSHNKKREWAPAAPLDAVQCRFLNEKADAAANSCRCRRAARSRRERWFEQRAIAAQWESDVIHIAAAASQLLQRHVALAAQGHAPASHEG